MANSSEFGSFTEEQRAAMKVSAEAAETGRAAGLKRFNEKHAETIAEEQRRATAGIPQR